MASQDQDLVNAFGTLKLENDAAKPIKHLPFHPPEELQLRLNHNDRYLFRVFDSNSPGHTDEVFVQSQDAWEVSIASDEDIFLREDQENVAAMINRHLWWYNWSRKEDNLVSWTNSLLFALQYCFYRHKKHGTPLKDIFLCVIDTTTLPADAFIKDLDLLVAYSESDCVTGRNDDLTLKRMENMRNGIWYFGEYLSQGTLQIEGNCSIVSIQDIIECGLYTLRPEFGEYNRRRQVKPTWAIEARDLRRGFSNGEKWLPAIADEKMGIVMKIGGLFGRRWKLPMAAACLALQRLRGIDGPLWRAVRREQFSDDEKEEFFLTKIEAPDSLPELQQFEKIRKKIWRISWQDNMEASRNRTFMGTSDNVK